MNGEPSLTCKDERRRDEVRGSRFFGLDYLEVSDDQLTLTVVFLGKAPEHIAKENLRIEGGRRTRDIRVVDLVVSRSADPERDDSMDVRVDKPGDFSVYTLRAVETDRRGQAADEPMKGFDRRYARLDFTFKAGCPGDLDCKTDAVCPPERRDEPEISYLAKDYASFRQLILDRLALVMPDWQERHVPDLGIALVEVLAYVGDYLSYYQDAVATEAYLDTARQRISVRRHARLVDYTLHEGCNARAWVTLRVSQNLSLAPDDVYLITDPGEAIGGGTVVAHADLPSTLPRAYLVYEPLVEDRRRAITLYDAHNEILIYTWGDSECCLPKGATSATLVDPGTAPPAYSPGEKSPDGPHQYGSARATRYEPGPPRAESETGHTLELRSCDVVIFEEVKGPKTGSPADADPAHRHAVRLTKVTRGMDPLTRTLVVEIEWAAEDALPFPVCVSSVGIAPDCEAISGVSVVRGNVLLVDHGERFEDDLAPVPTETVLPDCCDPCSPREVATVAGWYRPALSRPDLTFSEPLAPCLPASSPARPTSARTGASALLSQDVRQALPHVTLYGIPVLPSGLPAFTQGDLRDPDSLAAELLDPSAPRSAFLRARLSPRTLELLAAHKPTEPVSSGLRQALLDDLRSMWRGEPRRDLLASGPDDRHFVAEIDNERLAQLRFGDGLLGQAPDAGMTFHAVYRVGNGPAGNIGADRISHIVFRNNLPKGVDIRPRNPLPATGGTPPEPLAEAKLFAPQAFRTTLQRAIPADDYARLAERSTPRAAGPLLIQRAAAALYWTGSWYEAHVSVDPLGGEEPTDALLGAIALRLSGYRRMGHDLRVTAARYVPLDIVLTVCVLPHYLRGHVEAALLDAFCNRVLPDGRLGFFHPDNLSFGEGVYLSKLVATAQAVPGVESVQVTKLERLYEGPNGELANGLLPIRPSEIAQVDNDPSLPERGTLTLVMGGGR